MARMGRDEERIHNFGAETSLKATVWKWMTLAGFDSRGVGPLD